MNYEFGVWIFKFSGLCLSWRQKMATDSLIFINKRTLIK